MSLLIQIADAVVAELGTGTWSLPFTTTRLYRPVYEPDDLADLRVTVVPKGIAIDAGGRRINQHDCHVDIAVQKKLATADAAEIDPLMDFVQEIADRFRFDRLAGYPLSVWIKTEHTAIYAPEHLDQLRQFTSVLTLTFRVMR